MKTFKEFIRWDYSDLKDDIFYKSEVQANKVIAITMLNCALMLFLAGILKILGIFNLDSNNFDSLVWQGAVELIIPAILCFIFKGRKRWLKYLLLFEFLAALTRIDNVLTFSISALIFIPTILSSRYYSQKLTIAMATITLIFMLLASFFSYTSEVTTNYNVYTLQELLDNVVVEGGKATAINVIEGYPWKVLIHYCLPRVFVFEVVAVICILSAKKGREMVEEQASITENSARIEGELSLATNIQASLLPSIFPAYPERNEFDLYASMNPAKEVGGDFYDFFMLDEKTMGLVIADVSGKGVPAALFMVIAKTLIKNQSQSGLNPGEVFTKVNQMLCENNDMGLFVTAWMAFLNIETGELSYANAGHNPPLIKKKDGKYEYIKARPGFVLGGMDAIKYRTFTMQLEPGDNIFLYTDGVTEATNINDELYGEDRLEKYLNSHLDISPREVIDGLKVDLAKFYEGRDQFDDITMLNFDYKRRYINNAIEREFKALDESLDEINDFVCEELEKVEASMKVIQQINIATEEIFVNIAHYAYSNNVGKMRLSIESKDEYAYLKFIDYGMPFNPLNNKDPDITLAAEDRKIGGLGIFMVKKMMDDVEYKYENGQNILTLKKKIK